MVMNILQHLFDVVIHSQGFPIGSVFYTKTGDIISVDSNSRGVGKATTHKTHAEYKGLKNLITNGHVPKELWLCVTFPPCSHCLDEIEQMGITPHVVYLFDPRGKRFKNYMKPVDLKNISVSNELIYKMWNLVKARYDQKGHNLSRKRLLERQNRRKSDSILRMAPKQK